MLLTKFKDQLEDYLRFKMIPTSGDNVSYLPKLILGLKLTQKYYLTSIEDCIIEELYHSLRGILQTASPDANNQESFKSLSLDTIKKIVLYPKPEINDRHITTTKERFDAFMYWLSENQISEVDKSEIVDSFDFEDFTVEELLSTVKNSGFYSPKMIDKRLSYLFKSCEAEIKKQLIKMQKVKEYIREIGWYIPEDKLSCLERLMD